jgi:hypothetical protein
MPNFWSSNSFSYAAAVFHLGFVWKQCVIRHPPLPCVSLVHRQLLQCTLSIEVTVLLRGFI